MALSSMPSRGTRFRVWVKQADGRRLHPASPADAGLVPPVHAANSLPRHVLVIDDEPASREAMALVLCARGCTVYPASDLAQAQHLLQRHPIDAVVSDFRLPGERNGLDYLLVLRNTSPHLRTLLVTGETAPQRITDIRTSGVPFLHKPVQAQQLLDALAR